MVMVVSVLAGAGPLGARAPRDLELFGVEFFLPFGIRLDHLVYGNRTDPFARVGKFDYGHCLPAFTCGLRSLICALTGADLINQNKNRSCKQSAQENPARDPGVL